MEASELWFDDFNSLMDEKITYNMMLLIEKCLNFDQTRRPDISEIYE